MSKEVIKSTPVDTLPAELQDLFNTEDVADDLSAGVSSGFAVVSIRGSKWRIKHGGAEEPILDENEESKASIEVVLVKAKKDVSKIYYEDAYEEGDAEDPDCWSLDGIKPDPSAKNPQSKGCASCKWNQWGSRMTDSGKKAKACADNRRVAVVPVNDLKNEELGGPMLLRVPAASLGDLASYGKKLAGISLSYNAIVTRLSFDLNASYPKLKFKAVRPLNSEELQVIAGHLKGDLVPVILGDAAPPADLSPDDEEEEEDGADVGFEEEEEDEIPPPKPAAKKKTKKKAAKKVAKKKEEEEEEAEDEDDDLNEILKSLDSLS